jgi:histone-binding protein RBBP4
MAPLTTYKGHSSVVGDVAWHNLQENIFASVGDDRMMLVCVRVGSLMICGGF